MKNLYAIFAVCLVFGLTFVSAGCSISHSVKSSSTSIGNSSDSSSDSSSSSSADDEDKDDDGDGEGEAAPDTSYRDDARDYTSAYVTALKDTAAGANDAAAAGAAAAGGADAAAGRGRRRVGGGKAVLESVFRRVDVGRQMETQINIEEVVKVLPLEIQDKVRNFIEFLLEKQAREPRAAPKLDWRGALCDLGDQYTSVELERKALERFW